jgi:FixJ family two-component response regulator
MAGARILIIDDEEHLRETMQFALEAVGYKADTAEDGSEGLEKYGGGQDWELVLLDQRMPGMDGLEVLRRLRERDPTARVMMVTAYGTIELAVDAMKAGAIDFLRKPFTPDVLREAVRGTLPHPRQASSKADLSLTQLLPRSGAARPREVGPLIQFRTLNGYWFWELPLPPGGEETEALRVRRAFQVKAPSGGEGRCAVEITTSVRELIRQETGRDHPPDDPLWNTVCKGALSHYLWIQAQMPPEVLPIYELTREQLHVVRGLAGLGPLPF